MSNELELETLDQITAAILKLSVKISAHISALEADGDIVPILSTYHALKAKHTALETARKAVGKPLLYLEKNLIPRRLEELGTDKVRVPELKRTFYTVEKYSTRVINKEALYAWLTENGAGDLITETVNAGTLTAFAKSKLLDEGVELPSDVAELTSYTSTGSSAYTPTKSATKGREKANG